MALLLAWAPEAAPPRNGGPGSGHCALQCPEILSLPSLLAMHVLVVPIAFHELFRSALLEESLLSPGHLSCSTQLKFAAQLGSAELAQLGSTELAQLKLAAELGSAELSSLARRAPQLIPQPDL